MVLVGSYLIAGGAAAQWTDANTCNLDKPPTNAQRQLASDRPGAPTVISFPDPRAVPVNYTGCLNIWFALPTEDVRVLEAKFVDGKIRWGKLGKGEIYCEYEDDKVVKQQVDPEVEKRAEALYPKPPVFCPPGTELVPSMWK